uniref:Uncharacterized protein n=1 Tax=Athene cunicularia TaxID=194338 RepID=A0A663ME04_ATHCN
AVSPGLALAVQLLEQHQVSATCPIRPRLRLHTKMAVEGDLEALDGVGAHVLVHGHLQREAGAGRGTLRHLQRHLGTGEAWRVVVDVAHLQLHVHQAVALPPAAHHVEGQDALGGLPAQPLPVQPRFADAQLPVLLPHPHQRAVPRLVDCSMRGHMFLQTVRIVTNGDSHTTAFPLNLRHWWFLRSCCKVVLIIYQLSCT